MELSDPATSDHSREIADLALHAGRRLGLSDKDCGEVELAARFHDIGKVSVPVEILRKPGPLDDDEWQLMSRHAEWGAEMLHYLPGCKPIARIVRHHHERYDGGGYPDRLKGDDIPLASRIIAVCDAYGAMVTNRPYRRALHRLEALDELHRGAGSQFDPEVVAVVVKIAGPVEVD
jgi:putative nucleotidyltransferase with HDIG domain